MTWTKYSFEKNSKNLGGGGVWSRWVVRVFLKKAFLIIFRKLRHQIQFPVQCAAPIDKTSRGYPHFFFFFSRRYSLSRFTIIFSLFHFLCFFSFLCPTTDRQRPQNPFFFIIIFFYEFVSSFHFSFSFSLRLLQILHHIEF